MNEINELAIMNQIHAHPWPMSAAHAQTIHDARKTNALIDQYFRDLSERLERRAFRASYNQPMPNLSPVGAAK